MDKIITLDWDRYKKMEVAEIEVAETEVRAEADYYISNYGEVLNKMFENTEGAEAREECWNSFKTRELAIKELNTRSAIQRVKKYIAETYGVFEPVWEDDEESKHFIVYSYETEQLLLKNNSTDKYYSPIGYLENRENCVDLIDNCKEDLEIIFN